MAAANLTLFCRSGYKTDTKNEPTKDILSLSSSLLKLHILVSSTGVKLNVDCQQVAEKEIKAAGNTSGDGYQVLGKMSKSIGSRGNSATVSEVVRRSTKTCEEEKTWPAANNNSSNDSCQRTEQL